MRRSLHLVVLMGGPSSEYAISLKSGQGVVDALVRRGWKPKPLVIPQHLSAEAALQWTHETLQHLGVDVVFLALHGAFGEDGTIQQLCEELQVAYTGSDVAASRLGMDKIASRQRFIEAGLHVPPWRTIPAGPVPGAALPVPRESKILRDLSPKSPCGGFQGRLVLPNRSAISQGLDAAAHVEGLAYPLIVKPFNQGSSIGVSKVMRPAGLGAALEQARQYSATVIVEAYIAGREVTVSVLGGRALPVVEIVPSRALFDYAAKYTSGLTAYHVPAVFERSVFRAVQEAGRRAHEAIGCRHFSRADMILSHAQVPVVLEVNTIPGFTPTSLLPKAAAAVGISYEALCEQLVVMAYKSARQPSPVSS